MDLCRTFGADGVPDGRCPARARRTPEYLDGVRRRLERSRAVPRAVGRRRRARGRNALRRGRRGGAPARGGALPGGPPPWPPLRGFLQPSEKWRGVRRPLAKTALPRAKPWIERQRLPVGIENHKDFRIQELVALLRSVDSPYLGACVDFGNNVAFLEDPLELAEALAPFAITTHLKDMAVRPYEQGFELSEVPLGSGFLPLVRMVEVLRKQRPEAPLVPGDDHARPAQGAVSRRRLLDDLRRPRRGAWSSASARRSPRPGRSRSPGQRPAASSRCSPPKTTTCAAAPPRPAHSSGPDPVTAERPTGRRT